MYPGRARVLVVEDDDHIRNLFATLIDREGFEFLPADTAKGALDALNREAVDLILLDLGLPDLDGMEVIRAVREVSNVPIIVVSARGEGGEKAAVLDLGADDFLTKPFSPAELSARIRVALRHLSLYAHADEGEALSVGIFRLDFAKRLFYIRGRMTHVTPMEYRLLTLLLKNAGKVLTTPEILLALWGEHYGSDTQALRALISGLRRKIEEDPAKPRHLLTETAVGYRFSEEEGGEP